ncbi:OLC1v1022207C1 [Oldenlandia corymbosa var. corymbosa]|uniref:OLC1v1022207C1 n=1 Tax=Oldenlandia corymbosa var. corymbosa TaxID=529605 RepID=A0AAV1C053_OLDCO|nr:OLC1v1022207C1 [Oldenlandia corymbosa var. corymbosa]
MKSSGSRTPSPQPASALHHHHVVDPLESSRRELLSPPIHPSSPAAAAADDDDDDVRGFSSSSPAAAHGGGTPSSSSSWRLNIEQFRLPPQETDTKHHRYHPRRLCHHKDGKIAEYYKKQERLLEGFNEMETIHESGCLPGNLSEDELKQLARSERMAIHVSNVANLVLFLAKVYASVESRSLAVIASTLDSFLDLLSGFILWFTSNAMKTPNHYHYPIGKKRMQPVGIIVFASVMATLGLQILLESVRELISTSHPELDHQKEKWMIGIMVSVTVVKFLLMVYCRRFKNEIVRAYAQDHFFDVITNSVGLITAVLAVRFYWWIDPTGAILVSFSIQLKPMPVLSLFPIEYEITLN